MRQSVLAALAAVALTVPVFAQDVPTPPSDQISALEHDLKEGKGLTYVVIGDGEERKLYRIGESSRLLFKENIGNYVLYSCYGTHRFSKDEHAELLSTAKVVPATSAEHNDLESQYSNTCWNPAVHVRNWASHFSEEK
jgi:hypothetical protein